MTTPGETTGSETTGSDATGSDATGRERDVTRSFMALADSLVEDFDVVDLLTRLAVDCARVLDVAAAGVVLADAQGVMHVVAATSESSRSLELFQLQRDEGPCLDCYAGGQPVSVPDLAAETERWPQFTAAAHAGGFESAHALPLRLRDEVLGALGLFGAHAGALDEDDLALAQALAHVATIAILQHRAAASTGALTAQLQTALNSRVVLEQAKGVLAERGGLDMDEAFARLRDFARHHNRRLTDVAHAVVTGVLPTEQLLAEQERQSSPPPPTMTMADRAAWPVLRD